MIRVGTVLYGTCGGHFRDGYGENRVEAIGADWIVIRDERGRPDFSTFKDLSEFYEYTKPETDGW